MSKPKQVAAARNLYEKTPSFEPVYAVEVYRCITCDAELPPGKRGRECKDCRDRSYEG